jgi:hypothetical protein
MDRQTRSPLCLLAVYLAEWEDSAPARRTGIVRVLDWNAYLSQVLVGATYVASAFQLSRTCVFRLQAAAIQVTT